MRRRPRPTGGYRTEREREREREIERKRERIINLKMAHN